MTRPNVTMSLEQVARRLDDAGVTWAVFAGAAASVYGATHPLADVDILIPATEGDRVADLFPEAQAKRGNDGAIQGIELPGFDVLAGLTTMDLDTEIAARLTHHEIMGVTVPVIPPEDNILLKALWGRGPEEGKRDWKDVQAMMAHLSTLDWEYLHWRADACGRRQHVQQVLKRLEALWRQAGAARNHESWPAHTRAGCTTPATWMMRKASRSSGSVNTR